MLFIVKGQVREHHYMRDHPVERDELQLVEAQDADEAEKLFTEYFEAQSRDYDVSYHVWNCEVFPPITREAVGAIKAS